MRSLLACVGLAGLFALIVLVGGRAANVWDEVDAPRYEVSQLHALQSALRTLNGSAQRDDHGRRTGRHPRDSRWAREANVLCRALRKEFQALPKPSSRADLGAFLSRVATANARANDALHELEPPARGRRHVLALRLLTAREERLLDALIRAVDDERRRSTLRLTDRLVGVAHAQSSRFEALGARACTLHAPAPAAV